MGGPSGNAPGGASALSSVFTLLNSAVGAGILSLPFAFYAAGWAGGLLCTFLVAAIEGGTLFVLARYAEVTDSATYSDLIRKMLGRKASAAMSIVLIIYSYGSATAYLIILGDCFAPLLEMAFGQVWWTERRIVIAGMATAFMLPLCLPRTLNDISAFSSVTFYALLVVVGSVIHRSLQAIQEPSYDWGRVAAWRPLRDTLDALPILAFGFQCHTNCVAVWNELTDEPDLQADVLSSTTNLTALLGAGGGGSAAGSGAVSPARPGSVQDSAATPPRSPRSPAGGQGQGQQQQGQGQQRVVLLRRPPRVFLQPAQRTAKLLGMVQVLCAAIGLTATFYCLVGIFGYLTFPDGVHSNVLLNYPSSDKLMRVARVLVGVIQIIHYPVNHFPARNATRDLLTQLTGRGPPLFRGYNTVEVLVFFVSTLGLSLVVTDLGSVFKVIGGSCGAAFIFAFPGALLIQYAVSKHAVLRRGPPDLPPSQLEQPLLAGQEEGTAGQQGRAAAAAGGAAGAPAEPAGPTFTVPPPLAPGQASAAADYHYLRSKLFWAGIFLLLLGLGLLGLTLYTLLAPPI